MDKCRTDFGLLGDFSGLRSFCTFIQQLEAVVFGHFNIRGVWFQRVGGVTRRMVSIVLLCKELVHGLVLQDLWVLGRRSQRFRS